MAGRWELGARLLHCTLFRGFPVEELRQEANTYVHWRMDRCYLQFPSHFPSLHVRNAHSIFSRGIVAPYVPQLLPPPHLITTLHGFVASQKGPEDATHTHVRQTSCSSYSPFPPFAIDVFIREAISDVFSPLIDDYT